MNLKVVTSAEVVTFEDFWKVYPKRVGKPAAKAKWDAITSGGLKTRTLDRDSGTFIAIELMATPEELVAGAERYARTQIDPVTSRVREGGRFTAHPVTWLNQGRWMDEVDEPDLADGNTVQAAIVRARRKMGV